MASHRQSAGEDDGSSTGGGDEDSGKESDGGPVADDGGPTPDRDTDPGRPAGEHPLPPGPDGYPLLGNSLGFLRDPFAFYDTLAEYGDVVRWGLPGFPFTTLLHPDGVERVLLTDHERFERNLLGDFGFDFAPEGLFSADREQWRRQRRLMQPAFTMDRIRSYADTMVRYTERTAAEWDDGEAVALNRAFSGLTLRILAKALFDVEVDLAEDDEAVARAARAINDRVDVRSPAAFLPTWVPTPTNRRYRRAMRDYRERMDELVARRREGGAGGDDLLSLLLGAEGPDGEGLSEAEVRDNLMTFTFAGHETTSLGLTYAVMLLAVHDDVRERLQEELDAVLDGEAPGFEHVPELTYTDKVITEAMRLYPPAPVLTRRASEDAVVGGYRIPAGTIVTLPQFRIHTDERFYDDPGAFRPERWTDEFEDDLHEYAYFPFGGGPRHCIGMRFATLEMKLVVATLLRRFDVTLLSDPDPDLAAGATLQPEADVRVRFIRR